MESHHTEDQVNYTAQMNNKVKTLQILCAIGLVLHRIGQLDHVDFVVLRNDILGKSSVLQLNLVFFAETVTVIITLPVFLLT